jgi:hypothetical protein
VLLCSSRLAPLAISQYYVLINIFLLRLSFRWVSLVGVNASVAFYLVWKRLAYFVLKAEFLIFYFFTVNFPGDWEDFLAYVIGYFGK